MQIAFYAPMKSPNATRPSGDRRIARLFLKAMHHAGYTAQVATELRSWEGRGDQEAQRKIREKAEREAEQLIAGFRMRPAADRPRAWFTYHLYHKAPDWIGPTVSAALKIPYLVAEASVAKKQQNGRWSEGHQQVVASLGQASGVFSLNPEDNEGVRPHLTPAATLTNLVPFLDHAPAPFSNRHAAKQTLGATLKISPDRYWLLCVAMMREDAKLVSYRVLAEALERIERSDWSMLVVGDGVAQTQVRELFRYDNARQVFFLGRRNESAVAELMQASDLLVWPAVNEAIGMVALEAQANGLPVVWGRSGAIDTIVRHGDSGVLIDYENHAKLATGIADAIEGLLNDPAMLARLSSSASDKFRSHHTLEQAAAQLANAIGALVNK